MSYLVTIGALVITGFFGLFLKENYSDELMFWIFMSGLAGYFIRDLVLEDQHSQQEQPDEGH